MKTFIAYSKKDFSALSEIIKHLSSLKRRELITIWHDADIEAGKDWDKEITHYLQNADLILLLISPNFIASDYCYEFELKNAIKRHENREAIVVPIILSYCDWQDTPFSNLQFIPRNKQPIYSEYWHSEDQAFHNVTEEIKNILLKRKEEVLTEIYRRRNEVINLENKINELTKEINSLEKIKNKNEITKAELSEFLKSNNHAVKLNFVSELSKFAESIKVLYGTGLKIIQKSKTDEEREGAILDLHISLRRLEAKIKGFSILGEEEEVFKI